MKIGIDVGSTAIKAVFVKSDQIVWKKAIPTRPGQPELVNRMIEKGMEACSVGDKTLLF